MNKLLIEFVILLFSVGFITGKEHKGRRGGRGRKGPNAKRMMKRLDKNTDGKISKDEWMTQFKNFDANSDGYLTEEEINSFMKKNRPKHPPQDEPEE